jgi:hypothetical protein
MSRRLDGGFNVAEVLEVADVSTKAPATEREGLS